MLARGGDAELVERYRDLAAAYGAAPEELSAPKKAGRRRAQGTSAPASSDDGPLAFAVAPATSAPLARRAWLDRLASSGRALPLELVDHPDLVRLAAAET